MMVFLLDFLRADNSGSIRFKHPLGPLQSSKTTHYDHNLYSGELSWWGDVRIRTVSTGHKEIQYKGQYSESVYFGPLKVREKKCLRNGKSFVELEN